MKCDQQIVSEIGSNHSDTQAVIRAGKTGAKKRTNRRRRHTEKTADRLLLLESIGVSDSWYEEE